MEIAVKSMSIGKKTDPDFRTLSLQQFFVEHAHHFKENPNYPFEFPNSGQTRWCSVLEGGCQFAFDRDPDAPIRCIDCRSENCTCGKGRYALQRFKTTRVYMLDIDQNDTRPRSYSGFCKYHTLTFDEEQEVREMESRLMELDSVLFFFRSKCNGFRIAFDAGRELQSLEEYESLALAAEERVKDCTPDKMLRLDSEPGGALFHIDRITHENEISLRSQAYWSYPRVYHPMWLNPNRSIK
jgi:hypothetical protein